MKVLRDALEEQLRQRNFDVVDIVPIPQHGDRMVRLRTLEEILEDFEQGDSEEGVSYLLRLKPTGKATLTAAAPKAPAPHPASVLPTLPAESPIDSKAPIYLANGKLNLPYLTQNAELLFGAGEFALARNIYKTILSSGESAGLALLGIAKTLEAEGKLDEAKNHYEESIAYYPGLEAYQRLGALLMQDKKDHEAVQILERALALKNLAPNTRFELHKTCGNCWTRLHKLEEAEKHFQRASEIRPSAEEIRANLGALYLQENRLPEAKAYFQDAIATNPRNDKAFMGLGSCSLAENDKRAAHDYFAKALEINLNNPTAIFYLVKCAYEIKSYASAARIVEDYVETAPVNANLMYSLAGLQFHLGRFADARRTAKKTMELQPEHAGAKELLNRIERG